jgi:glycosyltransferase involved in cell wall biosynthesis
MKTRPLGRYLGLLRAEGARAFYERWRTRRAERVHSSAGRRADVSELAALGVPVLNVLPVSCAPSLGGVQVQLASRLHEERAARPVALLSPEGSVFRLECRLEDRRLWFSCGATEGPGDRLALALERAVDVLRPRALHVENLATFHAAGLSLAQPTLQALGAACFQGLDSLPTIVSVHDFACFCPRPLLIERPQQRFCNYSQDQGRCARCLASDGVELGALRALTADLWQRAAAVVCPSEFLRERLLSLWPSLAPARTHVIAPSAGVAARVPQARWPPRHVAFVGAVRLEKGAGELLQIARRLRALGLHVSAYGGGDPSWLGCLRQAGVRIRGFYAPGRLPALLASDGVDLALVPSIGPESYGLVLDECWSAGVPIVAFDVGAIGERVRRLGGGRLVPLEAGAQGLLDAIATMLDGGASERIALPTAWPSPAQAAHSHLTLYRSLGLL